VIPLVKRGLPEVELPFAAPRVAVASVAVTLTAGGLRRRGAGGTGTDATVAALSMVPALMALSGGELAAYHGVEHKAIGAYEAGAPDAAAATKEHDRCGSHLVAPMLAANIAGAALLRRAVERPGPVATGAVAVGSMAAAVEIFAWSERHSETRAARVLRRPGHGLQRTIGTREPTERQLEVGRAALAEILRVEGA
jgi:hypothetical protein